MTVCSTTGSSEAAMLCGLALEWLWPERIKAVGKPFEPDGGSSSGGWPQIETTQRATQATTSARLRDTAQHSASRAVTEVT